MDTVLSFLFLSLLFLLGLLLGHNNKKHHQHHLPPSPPSLPLLGHLHLFKKPLHRSLAALSAAHGPVLLLRFGYRRVIHVADRAVTEECFTDHDVAFANRPRFPSARHLSNDYTTLGSSSYGPNWRNLRRIATVEVLSTHRLLTSSAVCADEARDLARRLFVAALPAAPRFTSVDVKACTFELAMNTVLRMVAGKQYYGDDVEGSKEAATFREMVKETFALHGASNLQDFVPLLRLVDFGGAKKRAARLARKRNEWAQRLIDEHRIGVAGKERSMIGDLLELQRSEPEVYSDKVIRALCLIEILPGPLPLGRHDLPLGRRDLPLPLGRRDLPLPLGRRRGTPPPRREISWKLRQHNLPADRHSIGKHPCLSFCSIGISSKKKLE